MEKRTFHFYLAGHKEPGAVSFYNFHSAKFETAEFDAKGELTTTDAGVGEALEMLADAFHPLIRVGSRPAKKG